MNDNNNNNDNITDPIVDELLQSILDHMHNHPPLNNINQEFINVNQEIEHSWISNPMGVSSSLNVPGMPNIVFNHGPIPSYSSTGGAISSLADTIESDSDNELITPIDLTGDTSESDEEDQASSADSKKNSSSQTETNQYCPVCYKPLFAHNIVNTPCKHNTCSKCFFRWIRKNPNCPMCRLDFTSWDRLTTDDFNTEIKEINELYKTVLDNLIHSVKEEKSVNEQLYEKDLELKEKQKELKDITESCARRRKMTNFIRGYNHAIMIGENDKIPYYEEAEYCKGYRKGCRERNYFLNAMGIRKYDFLNYHPIKVLYKKIIHNKPVRIIRRSRSIKKKLLRELIDLFNEDDQSLSDENTST